MTTKVSDVFLPLPEGGNAPIYALEYVDADEAATAMRKGHFKRFPQGTREVNGFQVPVIGVVGDIAGHRDHDPRSGNWTVLPGDANSSVPSNGAGTTTLNVDTFDENFKAMEIPLFAAGARLLAAGPGISLVVIGGGAASVAAKGSSLVVTRGSTPTEFFVGKIGA